MINQDPARRYDFSTNSIVLQSTGTSVRTSAGVVWEEVMLHARGAGWFRVGGSTVAATAGAGSIPLEAGEKLHLKIEPGQFIAWISAGGTQDLVIAGAAS
jgi:hypothetical protein